MSSEAGEGQTKVPMIRFRVEGRVNLGSFPCGKLQLVSMTRVNQSLSDTEAGGKDKPARVSLAFCKYDPPMAAAAVGILPGAFGSTVMGSRFKYPFKQLR